MLKTMLKAVGAVGSVVAAAILGKEAWDEFKVKATETAEEAAEAVEEAAEAVEEAAEAIADDDIA